MIRIRKFKNKDAKFVSKIIIKCLKEINSKDYPKKIINLMIKEFSPKKIIEITEKRDIYVVIHCKKLIGVGAIDKKEKNKGYWISMMFIHPTYQKIGVGKKLMNKLERIVKKNSFNYSQLSSSITSEKFYKRLGYFKIKIKKYTTYGKTVIMKKSFKS